MADAGIDPDGAPIDAGPVDASTDAPALPDAGVVLGALEQMALGGSHTCALLGGGAIRCWGGGAAGKLGYGNVNNIGDDETPTAVGDVSVGGTATQVVAGGSHTCALLTTGAVRCWGFGSSGRLGYASTASIGDDELPSTAGTVNLGGTVQQLAAGGAHTCALLDGGAVVCWGLNSSGQLGYGNIIDVGDNETPVSVGTVNVGGTVIQLAAGEMHTCALLDSGSVRCWGEGDAGRLGYGNTNDIGDNEQPAAAGNVNVGGTVVQITTGNAHTCALLTTGAVRCWGSGLSGVLGYANLDNIGDNETPSAAGDVNVGGMVTQVALGSSHTCVLLDTLRVRCWGLGSTGALGYGNTSNIGDGEAPFSAGDVQVGGDVANVSLGGHTCAVLGSGGIRCWGNGGLGKLGYGNTNSIGDDETPASAGDVPL